MDGRASDRRGPRAASDPPDDGQEGDAAGLRPALRALSDGTAPRRDDPEAVIERARRASDDVERFASVLAGGGRWRLRRATRTAAERGDDALEATGRRLLDAIEQFQRAAAGDDEPRRDGGRQPPERR